jgi:hypothetical protein
VAYKVTVIPHSVEKTRGVGPGHTRVATRVALCHVASWLSSARSCLTCSIRLEKVHRHALD